MTMKLRSVSAVALTLFTGLSVPAFAESIRLGCTETVACYTADRCYNNRAGGFYITPSADGATAVVEGLGDTQRIKALTRNVYHVPTDQGFWVIVLAKDKASYVMTQAFPDLSDGAVLTGPCQRSGS